MTSREDLCDLSAVDAARLIARRDMSSIELTEAVIRRAEQVDPVLRILALTMADAARAAARQADAALDEGKPTGALHGVPITIKDNVAVAGTPSRFGSAASADTIAPADALVVARIRAAGAILIGKTTLPEFAHKVLTDNPIDGVTRNPWNLDRTPGGSSGGASAALAAGVAPLAVGTDGGGSIRCPASCTGTVGLKATLGRIPNETAPDAFGNFFFLGPMARTVADVRLLLSVMQGPASADPYSMAVAGFPGRDHRAGDLRIGWVAEFGRYPTHPEVGRLTRAAMDTLVARRCRVEALSPACFDDLFPIYRVLATSAHATRYGHLARGTPEHLTDSMRASIECGWLWSATDLLLAQDQRTRLFRDVQALFETVDVIATPTLTAPPPALDADGSIATEAFGAWAAPLYPFNMTGHPALSVPVGLTGDGLPVGLQLVGPWFGESRLLDVAAMIEADMPAPLRPSGASCGDRTVSF